MTIVVYRNGVMAADSGAWASSAKHSFGEKLAMGPDGTLYGVAGHAALEHSEYAHGKVKILSHHNEAHHEHT